MITIDINTKTNVVKIKNDRYSPLGLGPALLLPKTKGNKDADLTMLKIKLSEAKEQLEKINGELNNPKRMVPFAAVERGSSKGAQAKLERAKESLIAEINNITKAIRALS